MNCIAPDQRGAIFGIGALSAVAIAFGLQMLSAAVRPRADHPIKRGVLGVGLLLGATAAYYAAVELGGEFVTTPVFVLVILLTLFIAPCMQRERPDASAVISCAFIIAGCTLMFAGWMPAVCRPTVVADAAWMFGGACVGLATIDLFILAMVACAGEQERMRPALLFALASLAGLMLASADIVTRGIALGAIPLPAVAYIVAASFLQLLLIVAAVRRFDTLAVVPVYMGLVAGVKVAAGALVFQEIAAGEDHWQHNALFGVGAGITFFGIVYISFDNRYAPVVVEHE